MSFHYSHSYLSEQYSGVDMSARSLSYFLREVGEDHNKIVELPLCDIKELSGAKIRILLIFCIFAPKCNMYMCEIKKYDKKLYV